MNNTGCSLLTFPTDIGVRDVDVCTTMHRKKKCHARLHEPTQMSSVTVPSDLVNTASLSDALLILRLLPRTLSSSPALYPSSTLGQGHHHRAMATEATATLSHHLPVLDSPRDRLEKKYSIQPWPETLLPLSVPFHTQ